MNKSELETLETKGPETVLIEMAQGGHGSYDSPTRREVEAWLLSKTFPVAKDANRLASEANLLARDANVIE